MNCSRRLLKSRMLESLGIMHKLITNVHYLVLSLFLLLGAGAELGAAEIKGITKPQNDVFLAFTVSGKIGDIFYKEGDRVAKGDVIASLEMAPELIRLKQLQLEAENNSEVKANTLELKQKEYDLSRMINAHIEGAAADSEVDNAKLAVDISRLKLEQSEHQLKLTQLKYEELKAELERRELISPIDGVIEILEIDSGESVEAMRPVVRIVVQDKLWVDLMVPLSLLSTIRSMSEIPVRFSAYSDASGERVVSGGIEYIAALADSASETIKIRIGITNPQMLPIGTPVVVELPDPAGKQRELDKLSQAVNSSKAVIEDEISHSVQSVKDKLFLPMLPETE